jgi:hypothetical protein
VNKAACPSCARVIGPVELGTLFPRHNVPGTRKRCVEIGGKVRRSHLVHPCQVCAALPAQLWDGFQDDHPGREYRPREPRPLSPRSGPRSPLCASHQDAKERGQRAGATLGPGSATEASANRTARSCGWRRAPPACADERCTASARTRRWTTATAELASSAVTTPSARADGARAGASATPATASWSGATAPPSSVQWRSTWRTPPPPAWAGGTTPRRQHGRRSPPSAQDR